MKERIAERRSLLRWLDHHCSPNHATMVEMRNLHVLTVRVVFSIRLGWGRNTRKHIYLGEHLPRAPYQSGQHARLHQGSSGGGGGGGGVLRREREYGDYHRYHKVRV